MRIDGVPVVTEAYPKTVRLVTTARLRDAALAALADTAQELADLAEIEGATSARLTAQSTGISGLAANELVYDVPHAHFINASFAYARPRQPNRFNGECRGAWYSALMSETCLAEIAFHMGNFLADAGDFTATVDYAELFSSLSGDLLDLRQSSDHPALHPDTAIGYPAGNALADHARAAAVQSVRQGGVFRLVWSGERAPSVERVA